MATDAKVDAALDEIRVLVSVLDVERLAKALHEGDCRKSGLAMHEPLDPNAYCTMIAGPVAAAYDLLAHDEYAERVR